MAMLKDTVVAGSLRATDSLLATTVQMQILNIPTASNGTTFGPGTNGQILKSNGTSVYWAADNNDNTKNTAGTTNKTGTKMFLVGATEQSANPTTYSNSNCYIGTDNCLYSGGTKVLTAHQDISGKLNLSGGTMTGVLYINNNTDAAGTGDTGALIIGNKAGANIAIDDNEVMARNNKAVAQLYLNNDGGLVSIGKGGLETSGTIKSTCAGPAFLAQTAAKSWSYLRLNNGSNYWDIATKSDSNSGGLEFRPGGIGGKGPLIDVSGRTQMANGSTDATVAYCALQIRESGYAGTGSDNWTTAPRLGFNWSGRKYAQIGLASNGYLYEAPNSGTAFYKLVYESGTWGISISGTAAKATGDANGNAIASTYLKLAGGTMTGRLTTNKALNMVLTGTGVTGGDRGSSANPRYFPAVWTFNADITPQDGDIVSIKIPCAGHDYGVFLSTNNGTNSYPIVYNTNTRLTTHFPNAGIITVQFDSAGSAASMFALAGQNNTTRVTVSGGVWRILNLYDSGNSNDTGTLVRDYGGNVAVVTTTAATYRYQLLFPIYDSTNFGYKYIPANTTSNTIATTKTTIFTGEFNPLEPILYYSHTDTVNANATMRADRLWRTYPIDLRYSFNTGTTLVASKDVYIVATLQSNGMAKLRNPANVDANASAATGTGPITQTLPSTDDGYIYILLGRAYSTTTVDVCYMHPVYYYRGGKIRRYTGNSPTTLTVTATSANWNSSNQQSITATGVTANNTIIVGLASSVTATQYDAAADAKIVCTAQAANSITVKCLGSKPAVNIPLSVVIID